MAKRPIRQRALDAIPTPEKPGNGVVRVRIGEKSYGVPVDIALGAVALGALETIPLAPPRLKGVHPRHGRPAFVIDCGAGAEAGVGLTVEHDGQLYTLVVDEVGEIETAELPPLDIAKLVTP